MSLRSIRETALVSAGEPDTAAANSIPAPSNGSLQETNRGPLLPLIRPVSWPKLTACAEVAWLWRGYLAPGHITLLSALWKAGKTTLLSHALGAFGKGGHVGTHVNACRVLVLSEESETLWVRRLADLGIDGGHVDLVCRPFKRRASWEAWHAMVEQVAHLVRDNGYHVVIVDTLGALWPVWKENEAGEVQGALMPLHAITEAGAAVLLVHHSRKGDGTEGQATRGSGALPSFADIIMEFRRFDPERRDDRRRVITTYGRFDETEPELVIELRADGYHVCGTKADAKRGERIAAAVGVLREAGEPLTVESIRERWESDIPKPGERTLRNDLDAAHAEGAVHRDGEGKKGEPYRYSIPASLGS